MAEKKELSIIIRAKDAIASGLASAGRRLKAFGAGLWNIGKNIAVGLGVAMAAIGAFAVKAIQAYAVQEKAVSDLSSVLRSYNEEIANNIEALKKQASAIQDETGVGDEVNLQRMARLRLLGVETEMLGRAAKAVVALVQAGMDEQMAGKAVAGATMGNYQALTRYIPALREASTEAQKAAIVNDFLNKSYQQAKDNLKTVGGSWAALKGRIGDAMEEVGGAIVKTGMVQRLLHSAADAAKRFGDAIAQWVKSDEFERIKNAIQGITDAIMEGGKARSEALQAIGNVMRTGMALAVSEAVDLFKKAAPAIGKLIGAAALAVIRSFGKSSNTEIQTAADQLGFTRMPGLERAGYALFSDEQKKAIKLQIAQNRQAEIFKELGIETTEEIKGETAQQIAFNKALEAAEAIGKRYQKVVKDTPPLGSGGGGTGGGGGAGGEAGVAQAPGFDYMADMLAFMKRKNELQSRWNELLDEGNKLIAQDKLEKQRAKVKLLEDELAARQEIAKMQVADFIAEKRKGDPEAAQKAKDARRAKELAGRAGRGTKLSPKDQEFLNAFNTIQNAGKGANNLLGPLAKAKEQLAALEAQSYRDIGAIKADMAVVAKDVKNLMTWQR